MKILALTRYESLGASSRYRFYQYFPYLREKGCTITSQALLSNNYIKHLYYNHPFPLASIFTSYLKRIYLLLQKNKFDLIWLQQEAFPWFPWWFEQLLVGARVPVVVDYDDAFFHRYDLNSSFLVKILLGKKIDNVMKNANRIIVGNEYLADRAKKNNCQNIEVIPTVVDLSRYRVKSNYKSDKFTIGWIGSPKNVKYLQKIENVFNFFHEDEYQFVFIGIEEIELDNSNYIVKKWDERTEVDEIRNFDVGIMPLTDNPWERGKCGFKIIQYMACGIPVVASPVGVNTDIIEHGINGFLAYSDDEWKEYLIKLKNDVYLRENMGMNGRKKIEKQYSDCIIAPNMLRIFNESL